MKNSIEGQNDLLKSARIARRWTPEFVSACVGVSRNTYIRWEAGVQTPRLSSLDALCKVFDCSPTELGFSPLLASDRISQKENQYNQDCEMFEVVDTDGGQSAVSASSGDRLYQAREQTMDEPMPAGSEMGDMEEKEKEEEYEYIPEDDGDDCDFDLIQDAELHRMLESWSAELSSYWRIFMSSAAHELESPLSQCLVALSNPALIPGTYQKEAAGLLSQAYQLYALLCLHRGDFIAARTNGMQALVYGQLARDWNIYVAAQIRLATIYSSHRRIGAALNAYNDALRCVNDDGDRISPVLHSCIFAGLAEIQAMMGRETEALQLLKLACAVFPPSPMEDVSFSYMRCDRSVLYLYQGLVFLRLGRPKVAWDAFSRVEELHPAPDERTRVDFLLYRAHTSLALGNMIQCCVYLEAATRAAQAIDSDLAQAEIYILYQQVLAVWGQEHRVQSLAALFQR